MFSTWTFINRSINVLQWVNSSPISRKDKILPGAKILAPGFFCDQKPRQVVISPGLFLSLWMSDGSLSFSFGQGSDSVNEKKEMEKEQSSKNGKLGDRGHGTGDTAALADQVIDANAPVAATHENICSKNKAPSSPR